MAAGRSRDDRRARPARRGRDAATTDAGRPTRSSDAAAPPPPEARSGAAARPRPGTLAGTANVTSRREARVAPVGRRTTSIPPPEAPRVERPENGSARPGSAWGRPTRTYERRRAVGRGAQRRSDSSRAIWSKPERTTWGSRMAAAGSGRRGTASLADDAEQGIEQEHHAADEEGDARHHGVSVRGRSSPSGRRLQPRDAATAPLCSVERRRDQGREEPDNDRVL